MSTRSDVNVLAEVGSVHDGSFGNACRLIDLAAAVGADGVKFQTHIAAEETVRDAPMPPYFKGEPRYEYFERTSFDEEQWSSLHERASDVGIQFVSSPFSIKAIDLLERVGVDAYKVASGEVTNEPLLEQIAATGRPVILSSGMSSWSELDRAVEVLRGGGGDVTLLQCSSAYPCPPEQVGLNVLAEMRARYDLPVGLSDHTLGQAAAVAALTLGATMLEKHLTFSRHMYGSDAPHSTEPDEFRQMVSAVRDVETMLKHPVDKDDLSPYAGMKDVFEKSLVTAAPVPAGSTLTKELLTAKKPGGGLPTRLLDVVVGRRALRDLPADHLLQAEELEPPIEV